MFFIWDKDNIYHLINKVLLNFIHPFFKNLPAIEPKAFH